MKTARKIILLPNIKTLLLTDCEKNCLQQIYDGISWYQKRIFFICLFILFSSKYWKDWALLQILPLSLDGCLCWSIVHLLVIAVLNIQELLVFSNMTLLILWICFQFIKRVYILLNFVSLIQSVTPELCKVCLFLKTVKALSFYQLFIGRRELIIPLRHCVRSDWSMKRSLF